MKTKKSLPINTSHMTKFVTNIPVESVIIILEGFQQFDAKMVSSALGPYTFEINFKNQEKRVPIYLSLQPWNQTETLLTLSYYLPKSYSTSTVNAIVYVLGMITIIILTLLFATFLFAILGGVVLIGYRSFIRSNNNEKKEQATAKHKRIQEDLMSAVVKALQNSSELQIAYYG